MPDGIKFGVVLGVAAAFAGTILCFEVLNYQAAGKLAEAITRRPNVSTVTSTWTSGGIPKSLTTTRNEGESAEDFARRHQEELNAMLLIFPRDP